MKRLTFEGNFCDIALCGEVRGGSFCPWPEGACSQRRTWERLKEYEDTGLFPDEIEGLKASKEEAVRQLAKYTQAEGWTSVKDNLPEYFVCVLVWCAENKCTYAAYRNARDEWHTFDDTPAGQELKHEVTHWKPAPAGPGGAE
jgi:hypothetical protein